MKIAPYIGPFIRSEARLVKVNMRVRLRGWKRLYLCVNEAANTRDGYAVFQDEKAIHRISPHTDVMVALEDDPHLGTGSTTLVEVFSAGGVQP